jgi:hypothetical protein
LGQKHLRKELFQLQHQGHKFTVTELQTNLGVLIQDLGQSSELPKQSQETTEDSTQAKLIGDEKIKQLKNEIAQKIGQKRKSSSDNQQPSNPSKRKSTEGAQNEPERARKFTGVTKKWTTVKPTITQPEDLVGKLVRHQFNVKGKVEWFDGVCIRRTQKNEFEIRYEEQEIYQFDLWSDFQKKELEIKELSKEDFLTQHCVHCWENTETGTDEWWPCQIIDFDKDPECVGDFFVMYADCDGADDDLNNSEDEDEDDDDQDPNRHFMVECMDEYYNGNLRFV